MDALGLWLWNNELVEQYEAWRILTSLFLAMFMSLRNGNVECVFKNTENIFCNIRFQKEFYDCLPTNNIEFFYVQ